MKLYNYCIGYSYSGLIKANDEGDAIRKLINHYQDGMSDKDVPSIREVVDEEYDENGIIELFVY